MNSEKVYLTFPTDKRTAELLKLIAKGTGKSQPELINEICKDFINELDAIAKQELEKEGIILE